MKKTGLMAVVLTMTLVMESKARFQFVSVVQVVENTTTAPVTAYTGAPDSSSSGGDGGTTWGGLGNGTVTLDLIRGGSEDNPTIGNGGSDFLLVDGLGIANVAGPDLVIYEANGGAEESELIEVEVSDDGVTWTDITETRRTSPGSFPEVLGDRREGAFASNYDISDHGPVARFVRITGAASGSPGQTTTSGSGFDLDAISFARRSSISWEDVGNFDGGSASRPQSVITDDGWVVTAVTQSVGPDERALDFKVYRFPTGSVSRFEGRIFSTDESIYDLEGSGKGFWLSHLIKEAGSQEATLSLRRYVVDRSGDLNLLEESTIDVEYEDASEAISLAIGPTGRPVVIVTSEGAAVQLFQSPGVGVINRTTFRALNTISSFSAPRHSSPDLAFTPEGDELLILLAFTRLTSLIPSEQTSDLRLISTSVDTATGEVSPPQPGGILLREMNPDSLDSAYEDAELAVARDGKWAAMWRERENRRLHLGVQMTSLRDDFEIQQVRGFSSGSSSPQILWKDDLTLALAGQTAFPEDQPFTLYGELNPRTGQQSLRLVKENVGQGLDLVLTADEVPILSGLRPSLQSARFNHEILLPRDFQDLDRNGWNVLEEEAGLPEIVENQELILRTIDGEFFPTFQLSIPRSGQVFDRRSYLTDDVRYEVEHSVGLKTFSGTFLTEGSFIGGQNSAFGLFRPAFSTEDISRQFFRIKVTRP